MKTMRTKDKIQLIREELMAEIPTPNSSHILNTAVIEPSLPLVPKKMAFTFSWRVALSSILVIALAIPLAIALKMSSDEDYPLAESQALYDSSDEVYGFIATSVVAMIYSTNDVFAGENLDKQGNSDLLVFNELSFLNRYLSPIEIMLAYDHNHFYRQASDNRYYTNKIVYDGIGLLDENLHYDIYYNEYLVANNRLEINGFVRAEAKTYTLKGSKEIQNQKTILQMTYYINEDSTKDYVRVSKNLNVGLDEYEFVVVKDGLVLNESKLSLTNGQEIYATLENLLEKTATFKIYASKENTFDIDYTIAVATPISYEPYMNEGDGKNISSEPFIESGKIAIDVEKNSSSYFISSNDVEDVIIINNPHD
ncbi:MAG TPA: hypothetical protein PLO88_01575 [Bacilli bacterium]|nr:hypothetical protein [Bacilli bacterium]